MVGSAEGVALGRVDVTYPEALPGGRVRCSIMAPSSHLRQAGFRLATLISPPLFRFAIRGVHGGEGSWRLGEGS